MGCYDSVTRLEAATARLALRLGVARSKLLVFFILSFPSANNKYEYKVMPVITPMPILIAKELCGEMNPSIIPAITSRGCNR